MGTELQFELNFIARCEYYNETNLDVCMSPPCQFYNTGFMYK